MLDGTPTSFINLSPTAGGQSEIVFNDDSKDIDFRVESDNSTNALFVQGSDGKVGINMVPDTTVLTVSGQVGTTNGTAGLQHILLW